MFMRKSRAKQDREREGEKWQIDIQERETTARICVCTGYNREVTLSHETFERRKNCGRKNVCIYK